MTTVKDCKATHGFERTFASSEADKSETKLQSRSRIFCTWLNFQYWSDITWCVTRPVCKRSPTISPTLLMRYARAFDHICMEKARYKFLIIINYYYASAITGQNKCWELLAQKFRLQSSSYFCVFKYARAVKQKGSGMRLKTESETVRLALFARVRLYATLYRFFYIVLILREKPTVLQSIKSLTCFKLCATTGSNMQQGVQTDASLLQV